MSDDPPVESAPVEPEGMPEPTEDSSPFELPPMDVETRSNRPPNAEGRDGDG
jgi:hypothetical protein